MAGKRDEFPLMGIMKFILVVRVIAPLVIAGVLVWATQQPNMGMSEKGPLILIGIGIWVAWEIWRMVKWMGFSVVITDDDIAVGKRQSSWSDVQSATVKVAMKFDTWVELTLESGDPLKIPAGISQKQILLTLLQKHVPDLHDKV